MKTTAIGILATILASVAGVLSQTNRLQLSIIFGIISVALYLLSLIVHRTEAKESNSKRPRLIVRNVAIKPYGHPLMPIENGKPLQVQWDIVNTGEAPCKITDGNSTILVDTRPFDTRSPYGKSESFLIGKKLNPGTIETVLTTSDEIDFNGPPAEHTLRSQKKAIYFYGLIAYQDDTGRVLRTAYCREYDPITKQFNAVNNSDFEYSD